MSTRIMTILMAAKSPLYAPIFLAKIRHPERIRLEIADYPTHSATKGYDPFVERLLSKNTLHEHIIGLADPMRMSALPKNIDKYIEPKFVGGLINKMCYWLIDKKPEGEHWENNFDEILVHPKGMSGFTVPCYDYIFRTGKKADDLEKRLSARLNPNTDEEIEMYKERLVEKPNAAFVTTNPWFASEGYDPHSSHSPYSVVYDFSQKDHFQDVVMTGIIVPNRGKHDSSSHRQNLAEIKAIIETEINTLYNDPYLAAINIFYAEEKNKLEVFDHEGKQTASPFKGWGPMPISKVLKLLTTNDIYNDVVDLKCEKEVWEKTVLIRESIEDSLDKMEKRRPAKELLNFVVDI